MNSNNPKFNWEHLLALAGAEVRTVLRSLPREVREPAERLPVIYERQPSPTLVAEGIEADTLGLFVGSPWADGEAGLPVPAHILLYLENIWDFAEADETVFKSEVNITFLHELGHYLGLDEGGLMDRGLE